jgi:GT2 family glycosyltransferase
MKVSIIIPVFSHSDNTAKCIESIKKNTQDTAYEIIAVDNGATGETAAYLKSENINLIGDRSDPGVIRAWNSGIKESCCDFVCIINCNIVVSAGWLSALCSFYVSAKKPGIVSPGTKEGPLVYDLEAYASAYAGAMKKVSRKRFGSWCMLVSIDRFSEVGLFSEEFERTGADMDLCLRLKKAGYESYTTGSSFVHYYGNGENGIGDDIRKLNDKWGIRKKWFFARKAEAVLGWLDDAYLKLRYGHLLVEK